MFLIVSKTLTVSFASLLFISVQTAAYTPLLSAPLLEKVKEKKTDAGADSSSQVNFNKIKYVNAKRIRPL